MVNIAKLAGFAGKLLQKPAALAVGTGIVGLTVGLSLGKCTGDAEVGDSFEKKPKTELKTDSTNVTKPEAKEEKPKFEYKPPQIGAYGIEKTDTTYYENSGKVADIIYLDKNNKAVHQQTLNQDGTLKEFTWFENRKDGYHHENTYNNQGVLKIDYTKNSDGSIEQTTFNDKGETIGRFRKEKDGSFTDANKSVHDSWLVDKYDSKGRAIQLEYEHNAYTRENPMYETATLRYTYHPDGSYSKKDSRYNTQITYDKNDRVIKEKKYDGNEQLKYTVIPKYNKEGDIVKRDTIRNE